MLAILAGSERCEDGLDSAVKDELKITLGLIYLMFLIFRRIGFPKSFRLLLALALI